MLLKWCEIHLFLLLKQTASTFSKLWYIRRARWTEKGVRGVAYVYTGHEILRLLIYIIDVVTMIGAILMSICGSHSIWTSLFHVFNVPRYYMLEGACVDLPRHSAETRPNWGHFALALMHLVGANPAFWHIAHSFWVLSMISPTGLCILDPICLFKSFMNISFSRLLAFPVLYVFQSRLLHHSIAFGRGDESNDRNSSLEGRSIENISVPRCWDFKPSEPTIWSPEN